MIVSGNLASILVLSRKDIDLKPSFANILTCLVILLREGCQKSKWKFKMAFAMKGGGLEGVSFAIKLF